MPGTAESPSWPPRGLRGSTVPVFLAVIVGITLGIGVFTFGYARGGSYLTDDPAACANCHVMRDQHQGWMKSSHRNAAVCNDCHTPPGTVPKYYTKALNGFLHSWAFTTGFFPDDIIITGRNHRVTEKSCLKCHEDIVMGIRGGRGHRDDVSCIACHRTVGHD
jgi:cytochrome c nitrite reductase small subunit